jgi:branched-chain amino acid transport system permease protein
VDLSLFAVQSLNSVQYGFLLFLVASGLTLVFGVMGVINLAHGSFYMLGAYLAYWLHEKTGSLLLAIALGLPITAAVGFLVERFAMRTLYLRSHLHQVLLTYGMILLFNEGQRMLWGNDVHGVAVPAALGASIRLTQAQAYPVYRLFISAACIALAAGMAFVIQRTRLGMMIRAGKNDRAMVEALGIDTTRLFAAVFSLGAVLAAFAGMLSAPVNAVFPGMGEEVLILSFVVVVIGGIGSIKGALVGAMLIGLVDTFGKVLLPGLAGILVYALMAAVLLWRPQGLFGARAP